MSKKDSKILFLDDDGQEIEFNVIEQTTIADLPFGRRLRSIE